MINSLLHLIGKVTPKALKSQLVGHVMAQIREQRRKQEEELPKVPLNEVHVQNCELVLNRVELLSTLATNATVAEVGVATGDFSESILSEADPNKLHLIDIWGSDRYGEYEYNQVCSKFESEINDEKVKIHRRSSTKASKEFENDYFDCVYIDTDHSYETTKKELRAYAPKVKRKGFISGHDYTTGNWIDGVRYGVIEAVHEFCVQHHWEISHLTVEPTENRSFAISRIQS